MATAFLKLFFFFFYCICIVCGHREVFGAVTAEDLTVGGGGGASPARPEEAAGKSKLR